MTLIGGLTVAATTSLAARAEAAVLTVTSFDQYRSGLARLSSRYEAALVDIGAEWCAFCKTIDQKILPDPGVQLAMERIALVKVDVTRMDQSTRAPSIPACRWAAGALCRPDSERS